MIPTRHWQHRTHAEPLCRGEVIELWRSDIHEWRNQQDIGCLRRDESFDGAGRWNPALEDSQDAQDAGRTAEPRTKTRIRESYDDARGAIRGSLAEMNRLRVTGIEKAEVVDAEAQPARQLRPGPGMAVGHVGERHVRIASRDPLDHLAAAHRFFTIRRQSQFMSAGRQTFDRRLEQP